LCRYQSRPNQNQSHHGPSNTIVTKRGKNFLGHVGYYRRFIENFTKIVAPMFKLLAKDVDFSWDSHCQNAFEVLKEKLSTTPVLRGPNWSLPFHIFTDASDTTLGVVLGKRKSTILCHLFYK
jgi:hypothetical protein